MTATDVRPETPADERFIAGDTRGTNFWQTDPAVRALLRRYLPPTLYAHLLPHFDRLGMLGGTRLDELARIADQHPPVLHARDRFGRDEDWIEYDLAYREMERLAYDELGLHAMSHRGGVLGWAEPLPPSAKYAFQYLFTQAEFGLVCPVNATDTSSYVIGRFGSPALKEHLLPRMLSQDPAVMWKGAQFMTEKTGGSDVGALRTTAEPVGLDGNGLDQWRLYGDKWFASHADAEVALVLARPVGNGPGTGGLGLFAVPRTLPDGRRNGYRIVRLKDKLGTRSMASGEIVFDGATAYLVGDVTQGIRQMMEQVNQCRVSHGFRAAAMMRRCLNEAMVVARDRSAFGRPLIEQPLMRRQLLKLMVPTEQALSAATYAAHLMDVDDDALRIMTPLLKFRACRDNLKVAAGALEVRGGNGYVEDWVNARLVRDAQIGTLWEGTSNINALDVVTRAVGKAKAHEVLAAGLREQLATRPAIPAAFREELDGYLARALALVEATAAHPEREADSRTASSALYHATTAILLAVEGADFGAEGGDARRLLLARLVVDHRLRPNDPLAADESTTADRIATLLLAEDDIALSVAADLVAG